MINFNEALGVHENALYLRGHRASILASNLAHADTPNFQARDFVFESVLAQQTSNSN